MKKQKLIVKCLLNEGYMVIPLAEGLRRFAVVNPDGAIISVHKTIASALRKTRRLNREELAAWADA